MHVFEAVTRSGMFKAAGLTNIKKTFPRPPEYTILVFIYIAYKKNCNYDMLISSNLTNVLSVSNRPANFW